MLALILILIMILIIYVILIIYLCICVGVSGFGRYFRRGDIWSGLLPIVVYVDILLEVILNI
jgi:hypothetical protein